MIIDSHIHLDDNLYVRIEDAVKALDQQLEATDIYRGLVLHLDFQRWTSQEVSAEILKYPRLKALININPENSDSEEMLLDGVQNFGFIGLKLHPRLQNFRINSPRTTQLCQLAGKLDVPVLIDVFPDGTSLMNDFTPKDYAQLATACPGTRMIWAHMGGHHVIDFMMIAKRLPNVYFDFSYSLLYFQGSSIAADLVYAMKSMKFNRIFYGSDYPDRSISDTLNQSLQYLQSQKISDSDLDKIMGKNAYDFFRW